MQKSVNAINSTFWRTMLGGIIAVIAALLLIYAIYGAPVSFAQEDTSAPTVSSASIASDPDGNDSDLGWYESGGPGRSYLSAH